MNKDYYGRKNNKERRRFNNFLVKNNEKQGDRIYKGIFKLQEKHVKSLRII